MKTTKLLVTIVITVAFLAESAGVGYLSGVASAKTDALRPIATGNAADITKLSGKSNKFERLKELLLQYGVHKTSIEKMDSAVLTEIESLAQNPSMSKTQKTKAFHQLIPQPKVSLKQAHTIVTKLESKILLLESSLTPKKDATIHISENISIPKPLMNAIEVVITSDFRDLKKGVDYDYTEGRNIYLNVVRILGKTLNIDGKTIRIIKLKGVCFNSDEPLKPYKGLFPLVSEFGMYGELTTQHVMTEKPTGAMTMDTVNNEFELTDIASKNNASVSVALGKAQFKDLSYETKPLGVLILGIENENETDPRSALADLLGEGKFVQKKDTYLFLGDYIRDDQVFKFTVSPEKADKNREKAIAIIRKMGLAYRTLHNAGVIHNMSHFGNIRVNQDGLVRIGDFEFSHRLPNPTIAQEVAYRTNDIRNFFTSLDICFPPELLEDLIDLYNIDIAREFLIGYMGEQVREGALNYITEYTLNTLLADLTYDPNAIERNPFLLSIKSVLKKDKGGNYNLFDIETSLSDEKVESRIKRFLDDPQIFEAIAKALEKKDIPAELIKKIVIKESGHVAGRESAIVVDREAGAIIIYLSEIKDDFMSKLYQKVTAFLDQPILESEFTATEHGALLPPDELERALRVARWEDFRIDEYSGGRAVFLRLKNPITYNEVVYDRIKIKGVVLKWVLQPKPQRFLKHGVEKGDIRIPDVDKAGRIVLYEQFNPQGGLMADTAVNEVAMMQESFNSRVTLDIPVGSGKYLGLTAEENNMGFVISLAPKGFVSTIDAINTVMKNLAEKLKRMSRRENIDIAKMRGKIENILYMQGKNLREAHDKNIFLAYPHWDNSYTVDGKYYWKDFSEAQSIPDGQPERALAFRFSDIAVALEHMDQLPFYIDPKLKERMYKEYMLRPDLYFLAGYFYDRLYVIDREFYKIQEADVVRMLDKSMSKPVTEQDFILIRILDDLVRDKKEPDADNIPRISLAYAYGDPDHIVYKTALAMAKEEKLPYEDELRKKGIWYINLVETSDVRGVEYDLNAHLAYIFIPTYYEKKEVRATIREELMALAKRLPRYNKKQENGLSVKGTPNIKAGTIAVDNLILNKIASSA